MKTVNNMNLEDTLKRGRTRTDRGFKNERKPIDLSVVQVNAAGPFDNYQRQKMLFFQPLSEMAQQYGHGSHNQFGGTQYMHHPLTPPMHYTQESTHFSNNGGLPSVMQSTYDHMGSATNV